jgi:hypothetical protein
MESKYQKKTETGQTIGEVQQNIQKKMTQKDHKSKKDYSRQESKLELKDVILLW